MAREPRAGGIKGRGLFCSMCKFEKHSWGPSAEVPTEAARLLLFCTRTAGARHCCGAHAIYRSGKSLLSLQKLTALALKSQMCSQTHGERQRGTLGQKPSAVHLHDSADEDVVALMVDSVSHQDFVHHWNENLVLSEEREEIRKVTLQRGRQRAITPMSYS